MQKWENRIRPLCCGLSICFFMYASEQPLFPPSIKEVRHYQLRESFLCGTKLLVAATQVGTAMYGSLNKIDYGSLMQNNEEEIRKATSLVFAFSTITGFLDLNHLLQNTRLLRKNPIRFIKNGFGCIPHMFGSAPVSTTSLAFLLATMDFIDQNSIHGILLLGGIVGLSLGSTISYLRLKALAQMKSTICEESRSDHIVEIEPDHLMLESVAESDRSEDEVGEMYDSDNDDD